MPNSNAPLKNFRVIDLAPKSECMLSAVLTSLGKTPKSLSPKYFYDEAGSKLFDQICDLPEYYVTRTELAIMRQMGDIDFGTDRPLAIIELGGACSMKFRRLLTVLPKVAKYIAIDISADAVVRAGEQLAKDIPDLEVIAISADYQQLPTIPWSELTKGCTPVVYFPGSTIGNLSAEEARALLKTCRVIAGEDGFMLLGCDLLKSPAVLIPAYDDAQGVTARFNLNILAHLNRELGADFDLKRFRHTVKFNQDEGKIEMYLVSDGAQTVHLGGQEISFTAGETIHTEDSRKYRPADIGTMARATGFNISDWWTDPESRFGIALLAAVPTRNKFSAKRDRLAPTRRQTATSHRYGHVIK